VDKTVQAWDKPAVRWGSLVIILVIATLFRVPFVSDLGYKGDLEHFAIWVSKLRTDGLTGFYNKQLRFALWDRVYPPISTLAFEGVSLAYPHEISEKSYHDPNLIALIKVFPVVCEIALVAAAYFWLKDRRYLRYTIAGLFAIYPGLIATTAWWGQYDAPYTLFMVLALMALNRDRPYLAWAMFAGAILIKQPGIVLSVVILVPCFRRFGWRKTLQGILLCGLINLIFYLPFFIGSGIYNTITYVPNQIVTVKPTLYLGSGIYNSLSPYLEAGDVFPFLANNAYNFYFILVGIHKGSMPVAFDPAYSDHQFIFGNISYKALAFASFFVFVLLVMIQMWKQKDQRREFIWALALYYGLFMLPTQIHERYLYASAVFGLLAATQDRRMWLVGLGLIWTYSYNIFGVAIPYTYEGQEALTGILAVPTAVINVGLFLRTVYVLLVPKPAAEPEGSLQSIPPQLALSGDSG
jgi:Gpi18-like mannosyltransferase